MRPRFRRAGAALLLVLWAIAILSLLAGSMSFALRQDLAIANIEKDRVVSHALARAGVERAIAAVMDDMTSTGTTASTWHDNPTAFQDVALAGGTFSVLTESHEPIPEARYGVGDEAAKLNINVATREQLLKLPHMTEPIAAAILDWRDNDEEPQPDGIERGYYATLKHPYEIRNAPFRTVRELLLVRDVTPELFYGQDRNVDGLPDADAGSGTGRTSSAGTSGRMERGWYAYVTAYSYEKNENARGQKRLNLSKVGAEELMQRLSLERWAAESIVKAREQKKEGHIVDLLDVRRDSSVQRGKKEDDSYSRTNEESDQPVTSSIFVRIFDDLTLKDDEMILGKININTAPSAVLATLPGVNEDIADAIVRRREAIGGFSSVAELLGVNGITKENFGKYEESVTVRTNVFRIQSHGRPASGLTEATIECVIDRTDRAPRVLYWLESSP